jgi:hypothetical protein
MTTDGHGPLLWRHDKALTCVIKTNPDEHFSAITMIPTMISLDAYETHTRERRGSRTAGWLALRGSIGKEIDYVI